MLDNKIILYVEDDMPSQLVMTLLLESLNVQFHMFEDSQGYEEKLIGLDPAPDIILLDIHVLPHDGFEMLKIARAYEQFKNVPIVAVTASVMNEEIYQLKEAGFDGAIAKPINISAFPGLIQDLLNGDAVWYIGE